MRSLKSTMLAMVAITTIINVGCQPEVDPTLLLLDTRLSETKIDDLGRTMDFVKSKRQFDQGEFVDKVYNGLNRWATTEEKIEKTQWSSDPMVADLVDKFKAQDFLARHSDISFISTDAGYLQQCAWAKVIADRVTAKNQSSAFEFFRIASGFDGDLAEDADALESYLTKQYDGLNEEGVNKLASSIKLFDWVTRNIQLLEEPASTEEEVEEARLFAAETLAESGVPGTGYKRFASQILLYGRGDYAERAKVFILLLQQAGMDAAMFSIEQEDGEPRPWVVGVVVQDEFYLFDTKLGLPLILDDSANIATISQVLDDPKKVEWLDLSVKESLADDNKYWVRESDIANLVPQLYIAPEAVSRRMAVLESQLNEDHRMPVAIAPTEMVKSMPKVGDKEFTIWDVGFKTHLFRAAVAKALLQIGSNNTLKDRTLWQRTEEAYIDGFSTYRTARSVFLNGHFRSDRNSMRGNAIERFFALMYTEDEIATLGTNRKLQRRHGILKEKGQDVATYQKILDSVQGQMRLINRDAGYFLSQCHFDNGNIGAASNWLSIIREKSDQERWADGIAYLLGRAKESQKDYDAALKMYRGDKGNAQVHGNLIRARILAAKTS